MRTLIAIAAATLVLSAAAPAAVAGPPEYTRGYNDCLSGRYDERAAQYSHSYRQGCRAAQQEQGRGATSGRVIGDRSEARRLEFPTFAEWSRSRP